ncbi:MAG: SUMF1/EgtB/PvdO family nonheme iron enzyme [Spirochaeta sp.]
MSSKKDSKEQIEHIDPVRLPTFLGFPPVRYVPIVIGGMLLALVAGILLIPGLINYGSKVDFSSFPHGSAVYVDGEYIGATPVTSFIEAGVHEISIETPAHSPVQDSVQVGGRRIGSLFFPKRQQHFAELTLSDPQQFARDTVQEYAQWALTGDETNRYRHPLILAPAVHRLLLADQPALAETILAESLPSTSVPAAGADYLQAAVMNAGPLLSPAGALEILRRLARIEQSGMAGLLWMEQILPDNLRDSLVQTPYFNDVSERIATRLITETAPHGFGPEGLEQQPVADPPAVRIEARGEVFTFVSVPATQYLYGGATGSDHQNQMPYTVEVEGFYMLATPVTRNQYEALLGEGASGTETQHGSGRDPAGDAPVTNVNLADARRFSAALNEFLPSAIQVDWQLVLPGTEQWEAAARWNGDPLPDAVLWREDRTTPASVGGSTGNLGLSDMSGNVWEWTRSWYAPASGYRLDAGYASVADTEWPLAEYIVRGASWANRSNSVAVENIGVQPGDWRTDYLGFRLILEKKPQ